MNARLLGMMGGAQSGGRKNQSRAQMLVPLHSSLACMGIYWMFKEKPPASAMDCHQGHGNHSRPPTASGPALALYRLASHSRSYLCLTINICSISGTWILYLVSLALNSSLSTQEFKLGHVLPHPSYVNNDNSLLLIVCFNLFISFKHTHTHMHIHIFFFKKKEMAK